MNTLISQDDLWGIWSFLIVGAAISISLEQKYKWAAKLSGAVIALFIGLALTNLASSYFTHKFSSL
ncbi:hypothetical protein [Bavariicoccus seileri]|uniref:hypothetical protein n=1 Tax=Bavariicoccus seileri TaxID=549685 RepID=UPI003F938C36